MDFTVKYTFEEGYLPTKRHRKLRFGEVEKEMVVSVKEITADDAPVALIVTEPFLYASIEYRWYNEELWVPEGYDKLYGNKSYECGSEGDRLTDDCRGDITIYCANCDETRKNACNHNLKGYFHKSDDLAEHLQHIPRSFWGCRKNEQAIIDDIIKCASRYMLVDGIMYTIIGEPRYVLMTFGLGYNHGSTSLSVSNYYNNNISKNRYYNALDRKRAITDTIDVANGRGDTESVERGIGSKTIEVLIPDAVRCNPQAEHGDGCEFINGLEEIISAASTVTEAGVLAIATAFSDIDNNN